MDATAEPVLCPTCRQPAAVETDGHPRCANEACVEFGQRLADHEPPVPEPAAPPPHYAG